MSHLSHFHYQITGNPEGHKLVFLHGLMGSGANWRPIASAFANEYQILTYDQRGHGRSYHPESGYRPKDYAEDLKQILDELGWMEPIGLVGHSMGGRNALEFAFHFAHRVKGLVLEDIGPDASSVAIERIEKLLNLVPAPFASRAEMRNFFEQNYPSLISWYPQPQVISRFFQSNMEQREDGTQDWRFSKEGILATMREGRNEDRWDAYRNLHMPVLIMRGENSSDLSPEVFARMQAVLPSAKAVKIANAGHWVHFDQPKAFISAVKEFFVGLWDSNL